jgi:hypothetical protein
MVLVSQQTWTASERAAASAMLLLVLLGWLVVVSLTLGYLDKWLCSTLIACKIDATH